MPAAAAACNVFCKGKNRNARKGSCSLSSQIWTYCTRLFSGSRLLCVPSSRRSEINHCCRASVSISHLLPRNRHMTCALRLIQPPDRPFSPPHNPFTAGGWAGKRAICAVAGEETDASPLFDLLCVNCLHSAQQCSAALVVLCHTRAYDAHSCLHTDVRVPIFNNGQRYYLFCWDVCRHACINLLPALRIRFSCCC
ncbi:hypothetical protein GQ54DRAFT_171729 [Martensiomyces pterosporus]|nr:hypothetical protein GQ54DRAFT_171729 [Martensiomyces pterosporus]